MKTNIVIAAGAAVLGLTVYFFSIKKTDSPNPVDATTSTTIETDAAFASSDAANAFQESITSDINSSTLFNLSSLSNGIAVFEVNASAEIAINGPEGTEITFPANAFVDKKGNPVSGNVKIELNECYNLADMIGNKLSTKSNKELLETAGMVHIKVSQNGEELKLAEGISYDVAFPKNSDKNDFHLFYGQRNPDGNINWILDENADKTTTTTAVKEPINVSAEADFDIDNCFIQITESNFRRGTKVAKMDYYNWTTADGTNFRNWVTSNFNPPLEMVNEFCVLGYQTEVTLKVDPNGNIIDRYLSKQSVFNWDTEILRLVDQMPALDVSGYMPKYEEDHAVILSFSRKTVNNSSKEMLVQLEKNFKKNEEGELISADRNSLSQYAYSASELGWLNCDRFIEEPGERQEIFVKCPNSNKSEMYMALQKYNGLLCGTAVDGGFVFADVPKNMAVKFISIQSSGQPQLAIEKKNTKDKNLEVKDYKPFTLEKLKLELSRV